MGASVEAQLTRAQLVTEMSRHLETSVAERVLDQALERLGWPGQTVFTADQAMELGIAIIDAQRIALDAWSDPRAADCDAALGMAVELLSEDVRG